MLTAAEHSQADSLVENKKLIRAQDKKYFKQLDGLRCLAVSAVMISHFLTYRTVILIPLGSMGVNLFFVLSGFLITRILLLSKEKSGDKNIIRPIRQFYIRRTLRIFPIYYLTIIFLYTINLQGARENIWWFLTYTFNIKFSLPHVWETNQVNLFAHLWSLSVEEQFYIFFPFLVYLIPNRRMKIFFWSMIFIGVFSRFILYVVNAPINSLYVLTPCCFDAFGVGALLAFYFLYEQEKLKSILRNNRLFLIAVIIYAVDIICSRLFIKGYGECRTIQERFLFSIICLWGVGKATLSSYTGLFKKFLENRYIIFIGKISYGLYIYHHFAGVFFYMIMHKISDRFYYAINDNMILRSIFLFAGTFMVATLSWYLIERPINKLKENIKYKVI